MSDVRYEKLNKLAEKLCAVAIKARRPFLAEEISSFLPVRSVDEFRSFRAQVGVLRTLLKLKPTYSDKLLDAANALITETTLVAEALR